MDYYIVDKSSGDFPFIKTIYEGPGAKPTHKIKDERKFHLNKIFKNEKDDAIYLYDFTRCFQLKIILEKIIQPDPQNKNKKYPILLKKKGTFPNVDDDDFDDDEYDYF